MMLNSCCRLVFCIYSVHNNVGNILKFKKHNLYLFLWKNKLLFSFKHHSGKSGGLTFFYINFPFIALQLLHLLGRSNPQSD